MWGALQNLELKAKNVEDLANLIVHYFYDNLVDKNTGEKSCALIRFFYDVSLFKS